MGKLAIETRGLKKSFGTTHAVAGVDLAVSAGGVYGVLGPNGAGKTTTIRMLATLLRPDAGEAQVLGYDVVRDARSVRTRVSLTGQFASVDEDLTGVGDRQGFGRRRHDRVVDHAVPRRGRPAGRPHRGDRPRKGHRRGLQRPAQGIGRRRLAARTPP